MSRLGAEGSDVGGDEEHLGTGSRGSPPSERYANKLFGKLVSAQRDVSTLTRTELLNMAPFIGYPQGSTEEMREAVLRSLEEEIGQSDLDGATPIKRLGAILAQREEEHDEAFGPEDDRSYGDLMSFGSIKKKAETQAERKVSLNVIHASLTKLHFIRHAVEAELTGKSLSLVPGSHLGLSPGTIAGKQFWIHIDPAMHLAASVPFGRPTPNRETITRTRFLSVENKKMSCPSFAIPAGGLETGGSCIGAGAGQTSMEESVRLKYAAQVGIPVDLPNTICNGCVSGDSRVLVKNRGILPVEDLAGTEFTAWSGKGWRQTRAVMTGIKATNRLELTWGQELRLTSDHEVLTVDAGMQEAIFLEGGDRLVFEPPLNGECFPDVADLPAHNLQGKRYRTAVEERFPTDWSFEVGLLAGYVVGNGSISGVASGYPTVSIPAPISDKADLQSLVDVVGKWCGTQAEVHEFKGEPNSFCDDPKPMAHVSWRLRGLYEFLMVLGLDKLSEVHLRRAPASVWTASASGVTGFLSGLFSTDGSVCIGKNVDGGVKKIEVTASSVSRGLLQDAQQMLFAFGIKSNICLYKNTDDRELVGWHKVWKLNIGAADDVRRFHKLIGFFCARKNAKLESALVGYDVKSIQRYPQVTSIKPTGIYEPVYDLVDVGEEHQFTANGISISNCYASQGTSFQYSTVQLEELARFWWLHGALRAGGRVLVAESISAAIEAEKSTGSWKVEDHKHLGKHRFFRLHDSGDFFDFRYAHAWMDVARNHPDVIFWAPTRTWAVKTWRDFWAKEGPGMPENLVVRPSAYHFNDPSPEIPGLAAGTTSQYAIEDNGELRPPDVDPSIAQWHCRTYYVGAGEAHACPSAEKPVDESAELSGKTGCRACWLLPTMTVQYTAH